MLTSSNPLKGAITEYLKKYKCLNTGTCFVTDSKISNKRDNKLIGVKIYIMLTDCL